MKSQLPQTAFGMILLTGLIVGALDGLSAVVDVYLSSGKGPAIIFQYIASAVFGKEAYAGGSSMVALGLLFHLLIATGWTTLYFILYPRIKFLSTNKVVAGILYGLFVWVMMNLVIVPMTLIPARPFQWFGAIKGMVILMLMIGIPVALFAHDFYSRKRATA